MACTSKQQSIPPMEALEPIKCKEPSVSEQIEIYDESREIRKHLAQEEALRQLEQMKALALTAFHRTSFNR
ncbi:MAG: hypothetical protein ACXADO_08920 [Candidatus Thorarchaeota archaeon]|jgi:vacuolar-type H+-ATPase subunit H